MRVFKQKWLEKRVDIAQLLFNKLDRFLAQAHFVQRSIG
jgi:hypothetical protein